MSLGMGEDYRQHVREVAAKCPDEKKLFRSLLLGRWGARWKVFEEYGYGEHGSVFNASAGLNLLQSDRRAPLKKLSQVVSAARKKLGVKGLKFQSRRSSSQRAERRLQH